MTDNEAKQIINKIRISNPFTMGLSFEEYVKIFVQRYKTLSGITISESNIVTIAEIIELFDNK